ncbi:hypothetical protein MAR_005593, partial [Mya arenaria]
SPVRYVLCVKFVLDCNTGSSASTPSRPESTTTDGSQFATAESFIVETLTEVSALDATYIVGPSLNDSRKQLFDVPRDRPPVLCHFQHLGLKATYERREGAHKLIRKLLALPFLPGQHIGHAFMKLKTEQMRVLPR